jgi:hypothetical protein
MSLITWTGNANGLWSSGSNWSGGVAPQTGDDVQISDDGNNPITVTYTAAAGSLFLDSLTTSGDTLSITGGTLGTTNGYDLSGPLLLSGGLLRLVSGADGGGFFGNVSETGGSMVLLDGAAAQNGTFSQTGGTLTIGAGNFTDSDGGTFGATVTGNARLVLDSQSAEITLAKGFAISTGMEIEQGTVALQESVTDAKYFAVDQNGTLSLGGNTLTLTGNAGLEGDITGGTLAAKGTGHLNTLLLDNGQLLSISGTYNQTGAITLGNTGSGTISVLAGGALRITGNESIGIGAGGGVLNNSGTIAKVGGSPTNGESVIFGDFNNASTGVVDVAVGTLDFRGPSNGFTSALGGTITGAGTVSFDSGSFAISSAKSLTLTVSRLLLAGSANVTLTTALSYNGDWDQTGGTLAVGTPGQSGGTLTLGGEAAFDGGLLKGTGTVLSNGAVNLGTGMDLEGNLTFQFNGPVSQTGTIDLGLANDAITVANVAAGDTWNIEGNASILGFNGEIENKGVLAKANGSGTSIVQSDVINTGTLAVDTGELNLSGVGTLGGSVIGAAVLDISGAYQFASGLALSVGTVILDVPNEPGEVQATLASALTYAGQWAQEGGTLSVANNGTPETLTLNGSATFGGSGAIEGPGTVIANGAAAFTGTFSLLQGAQLELNGNTVQSTNITLTGGSSAPTLTIGGVYNMAAGTDIGGPNNSVVGTVAVTGTLVASGTGYTPDNVIAAAIVDNGKIEIKYGEMQFLGPLSGTGSINISNGATLDLLGSNTTTNTVTFGAGGAILDLGTPADYLGTIAGFGSGDMVELTGFAFSDITPVVSGDTVTLTEQSGQSVTLTFSTAQTATQLTVGEGPDGWLSLIHL